MTVEFVSTETSGCPSETLTVSPTDDPHFSSDPDLVMQPLLHTSWYPLVVCQEEWTTSPLYVKSHRTD